MVSERSLTRLTGPERRDSIVAAARGVFAQHGFHGASTADIAAAAGCSEPTLYKHFASKHELFAAVLADAGLSVKARVLDALDGAADPFAALIDVSARLMADPAWSELMRLRSLAITMTDDDPSIRETMRASAFGHCQTMAGAIRAGQERGAVRPEVDPDAIGWIAVAISLLANYRYALEGEPGLADMPRVMAALASIIRTPPEAPR